MIDGASGRRIIRMRPPAAVRNPRPRYAPSPWDSQNAEFLGAAGRAASGSGTREQQNQQHSAAAQRRVGSIAAAPSAAAQVHVQEDRAAASPQGADDATREAAGTARVTSEPSSATLRQNAAASPLSSAASRQDSSTSSFHNTLGNGEVRKADLASIQKLKVRELRQLCVQHGLTQYGRKDELLDRLAANVEEFKRLGSSVGAKPQ